MAIIPAQRQSARLSAGKRGFVLLIAAIFMSVMLTFGLALASVSFKQQVLASSSIQSQYAFFAADAGLECALYADQKMNTFKYPTPNPGTAPTIQCDGANSTFPPAYPTGIVSYTGTRWAVTGRLSLDSNTRCVDVTVYKYATGTTYIFSVGYDVPCATVASGASDTRFVMRGLSAVY